MRRILDLTLPVRDSAVGHWRFRGNLSDASGNANTLIHDTGLMSFVEGFSEEGITAVNLNATTNSLIIPTPDQADFEMGTNNFSVESRISTTKTAYLYFVMMYGSSYDGWTFGMETGGQISWAVGDGTGGAWLSGYVTETINDGKSHHIAWTVDRDNDQLRIYLDGVESVDSPIDISSRPGSYTPGSPASLRVGYKMLTTIEEVSICKGEALTADAVAERAAGRLVEHSEYTPEFLRRFLPRIDHNNADLLQFMIPFETLYCNRRQEALHLRDICQADRCPTSAISALASLFGFEMPDLSFVSVAERRNLLNAITWIYRRKGTLAAVEKMIELLGFGHSIVEVFSDDRPFIVNKDWLWDRERLNTITFGDNFTGNLAAWTPMALDSWWRLDGGYLKGTGNGADDDENGILIDDTNSDYLLRSFMLSQTFDAGLEFGIYLRYQDTDNWLRLEFQHAGSTGKIVLKRNLAGTPTEYTIFTSSGDLITRFYYVFGGATLWVYDNGLDEYTVGIDEVTVCYKQSVDCSGIARTKKGLWVNDAATIWADFFTIESFDRNLAAKTFDPTFLPRKLQITLTGTPDHAGSKKEYLAQVLPNYVPSDITIEWP